MKTISWGAALALVLSFPVSVLLGVTGAVGATVAADPADPYAPLVETECGVRVPARVAPGERLVVRVEVECNTARKPTGELQLSVRSGPPGAASAGTVVWSETRSYPGRPIRVAGPTLTDPGRYTFAVAFDPAQGQRFEPCSSEVAFTVGGPRDEGEPPAEEEEDDPPLWAGDLVPGGLLPDTGGPALWLVALALGLVAGGLGLATWSRTARAEAAPRPEAG